MQALVLVCGVLAAVGSGGSKPTDSELKAYEDAKVQAKRDPAAHVRLALWCEAHGLEAQSLKHLAIAILADPQNATARGLMGLVSYRGQWQKPDRIATEVRDDAKLAATLAQYNAKREKTPNWAWQQWELARWCEDHGLKAEAIAHLTTVTKLDPTYEPAWKRLGCRKHNGRWLTDEQITAEKAQLAAQKEAQRQWVPQLERWRDWLEKRDHRAQAETALRDVTDPRAVPSIWIVFGQGSASQQETAAQLFGQIEGVSASRALAVLVVVGKSAEVRRRAAETLGRRDPREFVGMLIDFMHDPVKYEIRPVGGPGTPGVLFVENERVNVRRLYAAPLLPRQTLEMIAQRANGVFIPLASNELQWVNSSIASSGHAMMLSNGGPITPIALAQAVRDQAIANNLAEAQRAAVSSEQQLESDVKRIEAYNAQSRVTNERALMALRLVADAELGSTRDSWAAWWADRQGYAYEALSKTEKATMTQPVFSNYVPSYSVIPVHNACFGAGTPVRTLEGTQPIEKLNVGDVILTQDTTTGALRFEPIIHAFHNRPAATLNFKLGDETIAVTGIHRFWRAGKGWAMARDLKAGDTVRTLGGLAKVTEVTPNKVQPVFNLEVASGRSFFVGQKGALVHDNTLVEPVEHPFDAQPDLAALEPVESK